MDFLSLEKETFSFFFPFFLRDLSVPSVFSVVPRRRLASFRYEKNHFRRKGNVPGKHNDPFSGKESGEIE
ncbi:MAG: hypothetical protein D6679_01025 [Candidatus Hydrogenedentota bacterium]|nr:MAG: hypothetical protein D6679_01025 [Candidatus Hydrogenedentota bacterium]